MSWTEPSPCTPVTNTSQQRGYNVQRFTVPYKLQHRVHALNHTASLPFALILQCALIPAPSVEQSLAAPLYMMTAQTSEVPIAHCLSEFDVRQLHYLSPSQLSSTTDLVQQHHEYIHIHQHYQQLVLYTKREHIIKFVCSLTRSKFSTRTRAPASLLYSWFFFHRGLTEGHRGLKEVSAGAA